MKEIVSFTIHIPKELNDRLVKQSADQHRSRHAHILYILNNYFEQNPIIEDFAFVNHESTQNIRELPQAA